jgi:K+-transporting ATPase A subunit
VRRVDRDNDVWEISHDFVAKLFENVIGNWRQRLLRVILPILTPLLLIVWLLIMVFAVPAWENRRLIELVSGAQGNYTRGQRTTPDKHSGHKRFA